MAGFERFYLFRNTEQLTQEILDMRGEGDHQLGLLLGRLLSRIHPSIKELDMQAKIGRKKLLQKSGIQAQ